VTLGDGSVDLGDGSVDLGDGSVDLGDGSVDLILNESLIMFMYEVIYVIFSIYILRILFCVNGFDSIKIIEGEGCEGFSCTREW